MRVTKYAQELPEICDLLIARSSTEQYCFPKHFQNFQHLMGLTSMAYWLGHFTRGLLVGAVQSMMCVLHFIYQSIPPPKEDTNVRSLRTEPVTFYNASNAGTLTFTFFMFSVMYTLNAMLLSCFFNNGEWLLGILLTVMLKMLQIWRYPEDVLLVRVTHCCILINEISSAYI